MKHFALLFCPLLFCLSLAGCGFHPVYGTLSQNPQTAAVLNAVYIENIPDREGQALRNHIIDRLYTNGRPKSPLFHLEVHLASSVTDLGVQKDATSTRQEYNLTATYKLKDLSGKTLVGGEARSIVGYDKLLAQYATVAAKQSAADRATTEVGEQIVNRVSLYLSELEPAPEPPATP